MVAKDCYLIADAKVPENGVCLRRNDEWAAKCLVSSMVILFISNVWCILGMRIKKWRYEMVS